MKTMRLAVILALLLGTAVALPASERTGPEPSEIIAPRAASAANTPGEDDSAARALAPVQMQGGMLRAAAYVSVFVLLLVGAWYLLKRGALPRPFSKSGGKLQVLETRLLGNRQYLVVVEYGEAKMLLGVCQGRIDYLTPLAGHPLAGQDGGEGDEDLPLMAAQSESGR